jgi:hypothetical protein
MNGVGSSPLRRAALVLLTIAVLIGGGTTAWAALTAQAGGAVVVLLGVSPSEQANVATVRACADKAIDAAIARGATVTIAPIARSAGMPFTTVDTHLGFAARTNPVTAEAKRVGFREAARAAVRKVLDGPVPTGSSDVLSATTTAGRQLAEDGGSKQLEVCGDGHQVGGGVNFYRRALDGPDRAALAHELAGNLPDLAGIDVRFGAAGLDAKGEPSGGREQRIALWWTIDWKRATRAHAVVYAPVPQTGR